LRLIYDQWARAWPPESRGNLLGYFLRWQGDAVLPLIQRELADASLRNGNDEILLEALARASYSEPLAKLLENRLNGAEPQVAASAAWVLARHAGAEEKPIFQARLDRLDAGTDLGTNRLRTALNEGIQTLRARFPE